MFASLTAEKSWHMGNINLYCNDRYTAVNTFYKRTKASVYTSILPPLLSLSWYGSKSLVKCFVVIPLLSLLWTIRRKSTPSLWAFKTKKGPHMTTKEKVICEMSWLCGLCNVKQFAWLLPIDLAFTVKASACSPVNCTVSCLLGREEE